MRLNCPNRTYKDGAGFTVLEVLVSIALLSIISLGIYQATVETYRLRDILLHEGDFFNGIRLAMNILDRDVGLIYSPVLMKPEANEKSPSEPADSQDIEAILEDDNNPFWAAAIDKTGIRPSKFIGSDTKLSFISLSHIRVYKDAPESEFAKVTYELQPDQNPIEPGTVVLVRTSSPNAFLSDDRKDTLKHTYPLLKGITQLKYRYYRKDKDRWENSWDSTRSEYKNRFPDYIEVSVKVVGPSRLNFEGRYRFRPEVPLRGLQETI